LGCKDLYARYIDANINVVDSDLTLGGIRASGNNRCGTCLCDHLTDDGFKEIYGVLMVAIFMIGIATALVGFAFLQKIKRPEA
jgi:hypothetical protein